MASRSFSSEKSYEALPGSRPAMGHCVEKRLPAGGILDLFYLLRKVEIIPAKALRYSLWVIWLGGLSLG